MMMLAVGTASMSNAGNLESLLQAAVSGDADSLCLLFESVGPEVRNCLKLDAKWSSVLSVDDVMQVTYLEAFMRVRQFAPESGVPGFRAWLQRIADNNLRDAVKELGRQKRPQPSQRVTPRPLEESATALTALLGVTLSTPSRVAAGAEHVSLVQRALAALPPDYGRAVRLYDLEGLSIVEVCERMGRSPGAVHMLRNRAYEQLRELLGGQSEFFSRNA